MKRHSLKGTVQQEITEGWSSEHEERIGDVDVVVSTLPVGRRRAVTLATLAHSFCIDETWWLCAPARLKDPLSRTLFVSVTVNGWSSTLERERELEKQRQLSSRLPPKKIASAVVDSLIYQRNCGCG